MCPVDVRLPWRARAPQRPSAQSPSHAASDAPVALRGRNRRARCGRRTQGWEQARTGMRRVPPAPADDGGRGSRRPTVSLPAVLRGRPAGAHGWRAAPGAAGGGKHGLHVLFPRQPQHHLQTSHARGWQTSSVKRMPPAAHSLTAHRRTPPAAGCGTTRAAWACPAPPRARLQTARPEAPQAARAARRRIGAAHPPPAPPPC